jgi:NitT/TauT family transport system substrate-binding protein
MAKGLTFTIANPEAAVRIFWKEFPSVKPSTGDDETNLKNAAHILTRFLEMAMQGQPDGGELGAFIPAAWENTYTTFKSLGTIKGSGAAKDAYTSQFIKGCNDFNREAVIAQARDAK